jgi:hypothetical protein
LAVVERAALFLMILSMMMSSGLKRRLSENRIDCGEDHLRLLTGKGRIGSVPIHRSSIPKVLLFGCDVSVFPKLEEPSSRDPLCSSLFVVAALLVWG